MKKSVRRTYTSHVFSHTLTAEADSVHIQIEKPSTIKAVLDQHIIGQETAKKVLSTAIFNLYLRKMISTPGFVDTFGDYNIEKSNILMVGPSGCGKTHLIRTLADNYSIPLVNMDMTKFSPEGFIGSNMCDIFKRLVRETERTCEPEESRLESLHRLSFGIVFLDEVDKLAAATASDHDTLRSHRGAVQEELLKVLEGTSVRLEQSHKEFENIWGLTDFNTSNILFILSGAFPGLNNIINTRVIGSTIGFSADLLDQETITLKHKIEHQDLIKYGLITELMGRIHVVTTLEALTEDELKHILIGVPNNIIEQFKQKFKLFGKDLIFTDAAINKIVVSAKNLKVGARGLRNIVESSLIDLCFMAPDLEEDEIIIEESDII